MEQVLRKNISTIYYMSFFQYSMIVTAIFVPLLQQHGLSMSQILQTQALFALVVAIVEVPSGYLADIWGRKNTIIIGQAITALSFISLLLADSFIDFLIYEAIIGIGISLGSGADLALLYDSQTALNEYTDTPVVNHGNHIARLVSIEGLAGAIAAVAASLLSLWSLEWVLWAQFVVGIMAFIFSLLLVEPPRQIFASNHKENFYKVLKVVFSTPLVLWTAIAIVLFGLVGLYAFWLFQKYWELQGVPLTWFGYLWAVHCVVRGLTAYYASYIEKYLGWERVFSLVVILPLCGFLGMGLFSGLTGLLFGLAFPMSRGLIMVVFYDALNKRLSAEFRATVNSMVSLGVRGVFIVTGPLLGYLVDSRGVETSLLLLAGLFLLPMIIVLSSLGGRIKNQKNYA